MSILINWPSQTRLMLSTASYIQKGCYAYQWLGNVVVMYTYAKFYLNMPNGSRIIGIFPNCPQLAKMMLSKTSSIENIITHACS